MSQQTADDLDTAIATLVEHIVADAQRLDPADWAYASRMFGVTAPIDGEATVAVSAWLGRHSNQFRGITIDDTPANVAGNAAMAQALLAEDQQTRLAVLRVSRLPQVDATEVEVAVDYVEFSFDSPVDVADIDLGGFSLFGDI